jgi:hypothetical protein
MSNVSNRNGAGESSAEELAVVRVEDAINATLAGRTGASYQSPPQPREQPITLVWLLLGCASQPPGGDGRWVAPIAGDRKSVV